MGWVTLYTYQLDVFTVRIVSRNTDDPTFLDYVDNSGGGAPPQPPEHTRVGTTCSGFDQYIYYSSGSGSPYATYEIVTNSAICGYVPPTCDIYVKTFYTTPETTSGNNDATVNMFAVSSFTITGYGLALNGVNIDSNTTGYFTGLVPGDYQIDVIDTNLCTIFRHFTISPFDTSETSFKYRLKFSDIRGRNDWEVRFYDVKHRYDSYVYPIDIKGSSGSPVKMTTASQNEDKTEAIIPTTLDLLLWYDGLNFTVDEFVSVPEKSWKIELWRNGGMWFQGWLLPDQSQDYYLDAPYEVKLQATDGLPSLKGNIWGDGSGGQGYSTFQIQQYGLTTWCSLVKQCLDQLGYNYGNTVVISSLQYNGVYDSLLWANVATWSDILYDSSGVALDTYSALQLLLSSFKLAIFQHRGFFILCNFSDLSYINSPLVSAKYQQAFYMFDLTMETMSITGQPVIDSIQIFLQNVGFQYANQPINPPQALNYDKAYNIEVDIQYNVFALLYTNPSFEIGAVQGDLPLGFTQVGTMDAFCNYDPVTPTLGSGAYNGVWEVRSNGTSPPLPSFSPPDSYIRTDDFTLDQPNKLINVSFMWKVPQNFNTAFGFALGYVPAFGIVYIDDIGGHGYFLQTPPSKTIEYTDYLTNGKIPESPPISQTQWKFLSTTGPGEYFSEGEMASIKGTPVTDYTGWQSYSITTPALPGTQTGHFYVCLFSAKQQLYDIEQYVLAGGANDYKQGLYFDVLDTDPNGYYLIDQLEITISDGSPQATLQTGESHFETSVTGLPQANLKTVDQGLFTYPNNKRIAGNVFNINDYDTGEVLNLWNFALPTNDRQDRLPATISKAIARNYSRPMYIFEGDIETDLVQFCGMFLLKFYNNKIFQPFSVMIDCRNNTGHIIIIENDDSEAQFVYSYVALYANGARQITTK